MENPLEHLIRKGGPVDADRAMRFEDSVVEFLCRRYKLQAELKLYKSDLRKSHDVTWLTFDNFHELVPSFPIRLGCQVIKRVAEKASVAQILSRFENLQILKRYETFAEEIAEEDRTFCGLVFPWPYLDQYGMVVHNWPGGLDTPGVRIVATDADDSRVILEPLKALLAALDRTSPGKRWRP